MTQPKRSLSSLFGIVAAATTCLFFVAAEPATAQLGGGRTRGKPTKPRDNDRPQAVDSGTPFVLGNSQEGLVLKLKRADEDDRKDDDKLLGQLYFKPFNKKAKLLRLLVRDVDDVKVQIGEHTFSAEEFPTVIWKGLHATVSFKGDEPDGESGDDTKKSRPTSRKKLEVTRVTLEQTEVTGTIVEIKDGEVVLRCKPVNDQQWDHIAAKETKSNTASTPQKEKPVRALKLDLKILEDVTTFKEGESEIDLSSFEVDQTVKATIVYGSRRGILVQLRSMDLGGVASGDSDTDDGGRGNEPQPRNPGGRGGTRAGR